MKRLSLLLIPVVLELGGVFRGDARRMRRVRPARRAPRIRWGQAGRVWNFVRALTEMAENISKGLKLLSRQVA
jgi:hypothetical protein